MANLQLGIFASYYETNIDFLRLGMGRNFGLHFDKINNTVRSHLKLKKLRRHSSLADIAKGRVWVLINVGLRVKGVLDDTTKLPSFFNAFSSVDSLCGRLDSCKVLVTKPDGFTLSTLFPMLGGILAWGKLDGCILLWVFTTKMLLPFFVSNCIKSSLRSLFLLWVFTTKMLLDKLGSKVRNASLSLDVLKGQTRTIYIYRHQKFLPWKAYASYLNSSTVTWFSPIPRCHSVLPIKNGTNYPTFYSSWYSSWCPTVRTSAITPRVCNTHPIPGTRA